MRKLIIATAVLAGFSSAALASGIEPVTIVSPDQAVVVGTQTSIDPLYIVAGAAALGILLATRAGSSDGTN